MLSEGLANDANNSTRVVFSFSDHSSSVPNILSNCLVLKEVTFLEGKKKKPLLNFTHLTFRQACPFRKYPQFIASVDC